jgi:hypothetical protein
MEITVSHEVRHHGDDGAQIVATVMVNGSPMAPQVVLSGTVQDVEEFLRDEVTLEDLRVRMLRRHTGL